MGERFKHASVQSELTRLVRLEPQRVLGVPEAVKYLIGDHVDPSARAALKVSLSSCPLMHVRLSKGGESQIVINRANNTSGWPSGILFRQYPL